MKCATCGEPLVAGAVFCTNCGTRTPLPGSSAGRQTTELAEAVLPRDVPYETGNQLGSPLSSSNPWNAPATLSPRSGLAVASLVCGILGIVQILPLLGPIIAVITGHLARREIDRSGGQLGGRGMALAGLIIGYITLALYVIVFVLLLLFFVLIANS